MASGSGSGLAKGGVAVSILGGILVIFGILFTLWGPRQSSIFAANLVTAAQEARFWYLYFIPIFGIICMALGAASYMSESRGIGIAMGILAFALILMNVMFVFHREYLASSNTDFIGYIKDAVQNNLRIGWFMISFGAFLMLVGGGCLSAAFKRPRRVAVKEPETYVAPSYREPVHAQPAQAAPSYQAPAAAESSYPETEETPAEEEGEPDVKKEPPIPPEELLGPPVDDIPAPESEEDLPEPEEEAKLQAEEEEDAEEPAEEEAEEEEEQEEEQEEETDDAKIPPAAAVPVPEAVPEPPKEEGLVLEKEYNHIILEDLPRHAFAAMRKLTSDGSRGLCVSTMFPSKINKEYNLNNVEKIWISHSSTGDYMAIDPKRLDFEITRSISNFMKESGGGIIIIDGLEYLIVENGFDNVLKFLKKIGDLSAMNKSTLIIPVNPKSLSSDQLTLLKREFDRVHDMSQAPPPATPAPAAAPTAASAPTPQPAAPVQSEQSTESAPKKSAKSATKKAQRK